MRFYCILTKCEARISLLLVMLSIMGMGPVLYLIQVPAVHAQSNLIVNGTFDDDLSGSWSVYRVTVADPYPIVKREREPNGNYYLYFDTPYPTEAYVQQGPISIPSSTKVLLMFKEWGRFELASISIEVINSSGNTYIVDNFYTESLEQLNGARITKTYDLTSFAGQRISIRFRVSSPFNSGTITGIDDVRLLVADPLAPLITCEVSAEQGTSPEYDAGPGLNVTLSGQTFPTYSGTLTVVYKRANGTLALEHALRTVDGTFTDVFSPDSPGIWTVLVSPDGYLTSCERQFVVLGPSEIVPVQIAINGLNISLSNPIVQVKPGQQITGTLSINLLDNQRYTNLVVIGFNSWEVNSWDLVVFERGYEGDPSGLSFKDAYLPSANGAELEIVPRDRNLGSYVFNATWSFPVSKDVPNEAALSGQNFYVAGLHPSMVAPVKSGIYYIVLVQSWENTATDLIQHQHVFFRSEWGNYVPPSRSANYILAVAVLVVDVDPHVAAAQAEIACANQYGGNTANAQQYYSEALAYYSQDQYNATVAFADRASQAATDSVQFLPRAVTSHQWATNVQFHLSQILISPPNGRARTSLEYDQLNQLIGLRQYCQAKVLQDDILSTVSFDSFVFLVNLAIVTLGIGDFAGHLVAVSRPEVQLEELFHKRLGRKLRSLHGILAIVIILLATQLIVDYLFSSYPPGGYLILVGGVFIGWKLNRTGALRKRVMSIFNRLRRRREQLQSKGVKRVRK